MSDRCGAQTGRAFRRLVVEKCRGMRVKPEGSVTSLESNKVLRGAGHGRNTAGLRSGARGLGGRKESTSRGNRI